MTIYAAIALVCMTAISAFAWLMERRMHYAKQAQTLEDRLNAALDRLTAHQGALDAINTKADETRTEALRLTEKLTTLQNRIGRA